MIRAITEHHRPSGALVSTAGIAADRAADGLQPQDLSQFEDFLRASQNMIVGFSPETPWKSWLDRLPLSRSPTSVRARQTIYRAGEPLEGVPVICEGWAARVSQLSDGRRQILSFMLPGNLISTNAVFVSSLNFHVEAITSVRYSFFDRDAFNEQLSTNPSLMRDLVKYCLLEKEETDELATNLGQRRAEERIAWLILFLRRRIEARGMVRDQSFPFPLRQQHIADATGLTAVHVNRVLGALRKDGLVGISDGMLKIGDLAGLQRLAYLI
ncbi:MAG: Crp/Fnr family transcriptional regulator [Alphaproteobacteria bacterium]|nr:Crp/Fnr family transcriptional regulator [Alphaproteobacteria bacterium]